MRSHLQLLLGLGLSATVSFGCDDPAKPPGSTQSSAAVPLVSAAPSAAAEKPWFEGTWSGSFEAATLNRRMAMDRKKKTMGVSWEPPDGGAVGPDGSTGKSDAGGEKTELTLTIDSRGQVSGSSTGPLGELRAVGELDEKVLSVRLLPADDTAAVTSAFLRAEYRGETFQATFRASSGDSRVAHKGALQLTRGEPDTPPKEQP